MKDNKNLLITLLIMAIIAMIIYIIYLATFRIDYIYYEYENTVITRYQESSFWEIDTVCFYYGRVSNENIKTSIPSITIKAPMKGYSGMIVFYEDSKVEFIRFTGYINYANENESFILTEHFDKFLDNRDYSRWKDSILKKSNVIKVNTFILDEIQDRDNYTPNSKVKVSYSEYYKEKLKEYYQEQKEIQERYEEYLNEFNK